LFLICSQLITKSTVMTANLLNKLYKVFVCARAATVEAAVVRE